MDPDPNTQHPKACHALEQPTPPVVLSSRTHGACPAAGYMLSRRSRELITGPGSHAPTPITPTPRSRAAPPPEEFRFQGLELKVWGLGVGVWGSIGFGVEGFELGV